MISREKRDKLLRWMMQLNINEQDIIERFILGSGRGGQKVNKTASTVYLKHIPTGIEIKCQKSRSQETNRYYARKRLCEQLHPTLCSESTSKQKKIEKLKRQKQKRSQRAKKKMLKTPTVNNIL
ncbi:MAG: peptide chain release factor family protein [Legionella sp.]